MVEFRQNRLNSDAHTGEVAVSRLSDSAFLKEQQYKTPTCRRGSDKRLTCSPRTPPLQWLAMTVDDLPRPQRDLLAEKLIAVGCAMFAIPCLFMACATLWFGWPIFTAPFR
jgi:hypothetical protein